MPTKQPVPPPKFNLGDIVEFKNVTYRVINRRYTIGPWKYDLVEHDVLIPRHKVVQENLLSRSPLQVPPRFNIGDRVLHTTAKEVYEIQSRLWDPIKKWLYTLGRYLPHAPGAEPVTDTMYNVQEKFLLPDTKEYFDDVEGVWVETPNPTDGRTVTNNQGGKQSFVSARFDCIPPVVLRLLAQCLGFGARKYGDGNWKNIPLHDHLNHAMNHINEWNRGDRSEPHLVNAMARLTFALWHAVDQKQQPDTYIHPDEKQS